MFILYVAAIWAVAAVTPGPNFFVVARTALEGSRSAALAVLAGVISGTLWWGVAGWLGISALFAAAPIAYVSLKVAGGTYLVWLGIKLLVGVARGTKVSDATIGSDQEITAWKAFSLGLLTNLANPKSAFFVASLFAATLPPTHTWLEGAATVGTMVFVSASWYTLILLFLRRPAIARAYTRSRRIVDGVAGALFVGFGIRLLASTR
ncbi:LysE family transporter [Rhizobium cauense]|uniref:LysE family transporter n=1 Tax=Rhizobium cauense TaxID=1166683 RepID=UPI001C6F475D|nr:LysE family transporter [Rhizobium cauense]MBW9116309.1 LysE family transporter [Rhizobium cauense]